MDDDASPRNLHQALRHVREIRRRVLAAEMFPGYSGRVRALSGSIALLAAAILSRPFYPRTVEAHLLGWGAVLVAAVVANYSAVLSWFLSSPGARRDLRRLVPTVDALPPLAVGAILSAVLIREGLHDLLPGTWMCLYGLANLASRRVLPAAIWPVGLFYIACGAACLLVPGVLFTDPWPMGIVFFLGEWVGGLVFYHGRAPEASLATFLTGESIDASDGEAHES